MSRQNVDPYDAEHIREHLIADPRINALDVQVRPGGDGLVVTGNVETEDRRRLIGEAVAALAPGVAIRNDVSVTAMTEPTAQEVIS